MRVHNKRKPPEQLKQRLTAGQENILKRLEKAPLWLPRGNTIAKNLESFGLAHLQSFGLTNKVTITEKGRAWNNS